MKPRRLLFTLCISTLVVAQSKPNPDPSDLANQVEKLQQAVLEQQQAVAEQQSLLADQQRELDNLKRLLSAQEQPAVQGGGRHSARLLNVSLDSLAATAPAAEAAPQEPGSKESPLSFRIGGAEFTPGGFLDLTTIFRTANVGSLGTNFYAIPFSNQTSAHLTETRFTAQNSRISLKAHETFGKNDVTALAEIDFLGNDAATVNVSSGSHTVRERLYFVDLKRERWEILAGQAWGWLTPNRVGLSSMPAVGLAPPEIFFTQNMDFNYQVGLTWTRAAQFRVVYHPNQNWGMGVAVENPEQFGGQGEITFPTAFAGQLGGQIDQANSSTVPNLHPDIIPKIAYDTNVGEKHFHAEMAGLLTSVKIADVPVGGVAFVKHTKTGGGVEAAVNLELVKRFHFLANGFWSDGGGRYIFGMGPDAVVLPNAAGTDVDLSLVHSGSGIAGFETQVTSKTTLYGYYGGAYFQRNFALDNTPKATPGSFVGFGWPGSAGTNNRDLQEGTVGWVRTFWKNPQYGALQFITQASYLTRSPWSFPAGTPKNAHLVMAWADLRYVLP